MFARAHASIPARQFAMTWLEERPRQRAMQIVWLLALNSVSLEHRTRLRGERAIRALEIARAHADRLRLRFGFDRFVDAHAPFLMQHLLGDAVREGRAGDEIGGELLRFVDAASSGSHRRL